MQFRVYSGDITGVQWAHQGSSSWLLNQWRVQADLEDADRCHAFDSYLSAGSYIVTFAIAIQDV